MEFNHPCRQCHTPKYVPDECHNDIKIFCTFSLFIFGSVSIFIWYSLSLQAVDIWMHWSVTFVIFSLLQGALVNYIDSVQKKKQNKSLNSSCLSCKKSNVDQSQADDEPTRKLFKVNKHNINKISRILFPVVYLVFIIIYWVR